MYSDTITKRYANQAALDEDIEGMAQLGWYLREWHIRAKVRHEEPPSELRDPSLDPLLAHTAVGYGAAQYRLLKAFIELPVFLVTLPWHAVRGRKPIEAIFERGA